MARDASGEWVLVATAGDYAPDDRGMEQALVQATLAALNAGDPGSFAVFEPAFDRCYVNLVTAIGQGETPVAGTWPQAGPWSSARGKHRSRVGAGEASPPRHWTLID